MPASVAIGIMAYNEERNIAALLDSVLAQTASSQIDRIVVVASGCTDRTCEIVRGYEGRDPRISLIEEPDRSGKIAAVNKFLLSATEEILMVSSADLVLEPTTVAAMLRPFDDPEVGMTGPRIVPRNDEASFFGFASNLMWELHHQVALRDPKMGELIAFRNVFRRLNPGAICDELSVHQLVRSSGYKVAYAPAAIVHNKGPENLHDFISQRIHCIVGNIAIMKEHNMPVSTMRTLPLLGVALPYAAKHWTRLHWVVATGMLEVYCRLKARVAYRSRAAQRELRLWEPVESTNGLAAEPPVRPKVAN